MDRPECDRDQQMNRFCAHQVPDSLTVSTTRRVEVGAMASHRVKVAAGTGLLSMAALVATAVFTGAAGAVASRVVDIADILAEAHELDL
jgi:hypothetical protein